MNLIFLTKSSVPIIGHIAVILGLIMDGLFRVTANLGVTNIGLSIILFTLIINLLMWPLTVKQQKSSRLMSVMQPELQAIQKKYRGKTDNVSVMRMQNETKAVYAKYGTSMTGGCVFLLIQMPILFALYQVIYRIPAYVPSVYAVFKNAAEPVMQQPGYIEVLNGIGEKIRPALVEGATLNQVIEHDAAWHALSARANLGLNNRIAALEHARTAVQMEPANAEYQQLLQQLQYTGQAYQRSGIRFGYPNAVCANPFLSCLAINMLGRCLCGRGFFCC